MREIKFRAWLIAEKKMIDWFPQFFADHSPVTSYGNDFPDGEDVILMQFTGLHDKHGKEIYEGDILIHEDFVGRKQKVVGVMKWDENTAGFSVFYPLFKFEVIGNIYENPELLEGGK